MGEGGGQSAFASNVLLFTLSAALELRGSRSSDAALVPLTFVRNAQARGAVCLDGSSSGCHFQKWSGSGSKNWVLIEVSVSNKEIGRGYSRGKLYYLSVLDAWTSFGDKTIAEAVGDWFFGRREVKEVDCLNPCNPTCLNMCSDHVEFTQLLARAAFSVLLVPASVRYVLSFAALYAYSSM